MLLSPKNSCVTGQRFFGQYCSADLAILLSELQFVVTVLASYITCCVYDNNTSTTIGDVAVHLPNQLA